LRNEIGWKQRIHYHTVALKGRPAHLVVTEARKSFHGCKFSPGTTCVAPKVLASLPSMYPALTRWAKLFRAHGAGAGQSIVHRSEE
jgi:hypothetical protein